MAAQPPTLRGGAWSCRPMKLSPRVVLWMIVLPIALYLLFLAFRSS